MVLRSGSRDVRDRRARTARAIWPTRCRRSHPGSATPGASARPTASCTGRTWPPCAARARAPTLPERVRRLAAPRRARGRQGARVRRHGSRLQPGARGGRRPRHRRSADGGGRRDHAAPPRLLHAGRAHRCARLCHPGPGYPLAADAAADPARPLDADVDAGRPVHDDHVVAHRSAGADRRRARVRRQGRRARALPRAARAHVRAPRAGDRRRRRRATAFAPPAGP